jgi:hypothetical protein
MPNVRAQHLDADGLYIQASNGAEITLTRQQIRDNFLSQTGSAAARKQKTIDWIKAQIEAAMGEDQVGIALIDFDFDTADGRPRDLTLWSNR